MTDTSNATNVNQGPNQVDKLHRSFTTSPTYTISICLDSKRMDSDPEKREKGIKFLRTAYHEYDYQIRGYNLEAKQAYAFISLAA